MTKSSFDILWNIDKVNQQKSDFVDTKLKDFFSKESERYRDLSIFKEIFTELDDEDFIRSYYYHYLCEDKRVRDLYCSIKTAEEDGIKKGIEKGIEIGIEIGIEKGIEIGKNKKAIAAAKNLKQIGTDNSAIVQTTGLTINEIQKL